MKPKKILILGATGMLGKPVTIYLVEKGHRVQILARNVDKGRQMFGNAVEILEGSALKKEDIRAAMRDCDAVHISLTQEAELTAMQHVVDLVRDGSLERITYISGTSVCEENRWFEVIDIKMRAEEILRHSGIPYIIFRPTWVMETLHNFVRGNRIMEIIGKNPPEFHFFAATDLGRMVAASYDDDRALGKRLFIHGPEGITLPDALERYAGACHPGNKVMRLKLWKVRIIAKLTGNKELNYVTRLIAYFDKIQEPGDPTEANSLLGAPSITLDKWFKISSTRKYK